MSDISRQSSAISRACIETTVSELLKKPGQASVSGRKMWFWKTTRIRQGVSASSGHKICRLRNG